MSVMWSNTEKKWRGEAKSEDGLLVVFVEDDDVLLELCTYYLLQATALIILL